MYANESPGIAHGVLEGFHLTIGSDVVFVFIIFHQFLFFLFF